MKALIVDDEGSARAVLRDLLAHACPSVQVVGEAGRADEARAMIDREAPDLVLLDIELGADSGFDLLRALPERRFQVLFITAHSHYSIEALRIGACDYLMKPVNVDDLVAAVQRARANGAKNDQRPVDVALMHHDGQRGKLVLRDLDQIQVVAMADIIRCESDGRYTTVHFTGARPQFTVSVHLLEYERMLASSGFLRIHRSHLINLAHLQRVDKREMVVHLTDDHRVPVSTRKRDELLARL